MSIRTANISITFTKRDTNMELLPISPDIQHAPIIERTQEFFVASDSPDIPALETEIDRLVFALYGLTDDEIAVAEGKA